LPPSKGTVPTRDEDGYAADGPPVDDTARVVGDRSFSEAASRRFGVLLRDALAKGLETPAGVLGHHEPRLVFKVNARPKPKRVNGHRGVVGRVEREWRDEIPRHQAQHQTVSYKTFYKKALVLRCGGSRGSVV
jgi:hypothetical protein